MEVEREQGVEENIDLRGRTQQEAGENCIMGSFRMFTPRLMLFGWSNQGG
jgi:hypothetical protein